MREFASAAAFVEGTRPEGYCRKVRSWAAGSQHRGSPIRIQCQQTLRSGKLRGITLDDLDLERRPRSPSRYPGPDIRGHVPISNSTCPVTRLTRSWRKTVIDSEIRTGESWE